VDRWHPLSGVINKLKGYYHFLKNYPPYRTKICLIQYLQPMDNYEILDAQNEIDAVQENENSDYIKAV
jgi:trehalose-6-phosphate synthase